MGAVVRLLGSEKELGCDFIFKVQEDALETTNTLLLDENFAEGDSITVILGDNITTNSIKIFVDNFKK